MAAPHRIRVGLPSLLGLAFALLLPLCARASLDRARLISTVRSGPLEMRVALEDSHYMTGQRTCALVCITNLDRSLIPFVPVPDRGGDALLWVQLWRIAPGGTWFAMHANIDCDLRGIHSFMVPPVSPLEPSGSTCNTLPLNNWYGANVTPPDFRWKMHENLNAIPRMP